MHLQIQRYPISRHLQRMIVPGGEIHLRCEKWWADGIFNQASTRAVRTPRYLTDMTCNIHNGKVSLFPTQVYLSPATGRLQGLIALLTLRHRGPREKASLKVSVPTLCDTTTFSTYQGCQDNQWCVLRNISCLNMSNDTSDKTSECAWVECFQIQKHTTLVFNSAVEPF